MPSALLVERLLRALEDAGEPLSRTALAERVTGKRGEKFRAIEYLVDEGFVAAEGEGRRMRLSFVAPRSSAAATGNQTEEGTESVSPEGTAGTEVEVLHELIRIVGRLDGAVEALGLRTGRLEGDVWSAPPQAPQPTPEEISAAFAELAQAARSVTPEQATKRR
jgi:hypothetical protein